MVKKRAARDLDIIDSKKQTTVKEREKVKRMKGQSSQSSWKPESWMKLRQEFD